ncbi:hypothetical protein DRQ33_02475 [bacterium]|nr:MAG: hypothetical protein DRQ33_02475 [bacterium]
MLPKKFLDWAYHKRARLVCRQVEGEQMHPREIFLGFTTHTPVVITYGSAGINGSVKGIGFLPKKKYIQDVLEIYMEHIRTSDEPRYADRGLKILYEQMWSDEALERIDFSILGTLELAKAHTWTNIHENQRVCLLFYEPPSISFEVRCIAEIHSDDIYHKFLNAQHDMFHHPNQNVWENRPAYIFRIKQIYDNSASRDGFGTPIFP